MPEPRKVRMVRCTYVTRENRGWVPMGGARTKCPNCGAVVQSTDPKNTHYVELRAVGS